MILNQNAITKAVSHSVTPTEQYQNASEWTVMRAPTASQEYLTHILKYCHRMTSEYLSQRADLDSRLYYSQTEKVNVYFYTYARKCFQRYYTEPKWNLKSYKNKKPRNIKALFLSPISLTGITVCTIIANIN